MDLQLDFSTVYGTRGDHIFVSVCPKLAFKGERLVAQDSDGAKTFIRQIYVDGKETFLPMPTRLQRFVAWVLRRESKSNVRLPTSAFSADALGNGLVLPTCPPGKEISIEVEFVIAGKWSGRLLGHVFGETTP